MISYSKMPPFSFSDRDSMVYHPEESAFLPLICQKSTEHLKGERPEHQITDWKTKGLIWNSQVRQLQIPLS